MAVLNKKGTKQYFKREGLKIGGKTLKKFIKIEDEKIKADIRIATRNALLSGRKVIKEDDLK